MNRMCRAALFILLTAVVLLPAGPVKAAEPAIPASAYLEYARHSADWTWEHHDELVERWRSGFDPDNVFGYRAPGRLLEMAVIYAWLYEKEGDTVHADRVKQVLLTYGDYRSIYPEEAAKRRSDYGDGVPALSDFFTVMRYIRAFDTLNRLGQLSPGEVREIEKLIAHSMDYLLRTAEWGTMNRTMLRAESLAWAVRALPDHPRAGVWDMP